MSTTSTRPPGRAPRWRAVVRGSAGIAVAMMVMNVATYGFQMVAARVLGPGPYGGVAALMAFLLIVAVAQLGLQATGARRVSAAPTESAEIERTVLQASWRVAVVLGLALLATSPLVWHLLRLDSIWPAVLMALTSVPLTVLGGQLGVLQGERRWTPLGLVYLSMGLGRLAFGSLAIWWRPTETAAMLGVLVGMVVPVLVAAAALRRRTPAGAARATRTDLHPLRSVLRETATSSQALLAFFVLSNIDIVVARNTLDTHDAGLYAGGLILTKAVLFLPQFVVVVAFPAMASAGAQRATLVRSLAAVAACGVVSVAGSLVLSDLALFFVGGEQYADVQPRLWLFAVLGTLLALLQMLVYSVLARQGTRSTYLMWAGAVVLAGASLLAGSLVALVVVVIVVDALLLTTLLVTSLRRLPAT